MFPFFCSKNDTIELFVYRMILIEGAVILREHLEFLSQASERTSMNRMRVCGAKDIRSGRMDS